MLENSVLLYKLQIKFCVVIWIFELNMLVYNPFYDLACAHLLFL